MCGIAGILNIGENVDSEVLDRFTDSLAHRGPDGRGTFINRNIGLGHRRLAILDLSDSGKCPMSYGGKSGNRYWITYNGEIYNFLELRSELEKLGHTFKTKTDTEVILASYAEWGKDCLFRFNGMWAFAIWDAAQRNLFIARDRFGIKPLYYHAGSSRFAFASEIKAFLSLDNFKPELNEDIIPFIIQSSYAYEGNTDQTLLKGVSRLLPGHYISVNRERKVELKKWWETSEHIPEIPKKYEEQVEQFRSIFLDSVRIRMRSDVPIGTSLSGGIDSGSVASAMFRLHQNNSENLERCSDDWQRTFIATFPGTMLDEKKYADEVVNHIKSVPYCWNFKQEDFLNNFVDSVWSMEDVYGGLTKPIWNTYREMRKNNVIVSLDGHGADELLCGYTWYLGWPVKDVNKFLYNDFHFSLLPSILRNYDRCSMAHGVEVRMPFMDWRLVTFSFGLPAGSKIGEGYTKRILRDSMKDILPEKIRKRISKIGFNSPMIELFNESMAPFLQKIVNHPLWNESKFWDGKLWKEKVLDKTLSKSWTYEDWGETLNIWTLINIVLWQLLFIYQERKEINNMF